MDEFPQEISETDRLLCISEKQILRPLNKLQTIDNKLGLLACETKHPLLYISKLIENYTHTNI